MNKLTEFIKKRKELFLGTSIAMASTISSFADGGPATGNSDLDVVIASMESGTDSIKKGGLYIIAFVILVAVVFFGARWLWNMWRGWMSKSQ